MTAAQAARALVAAGDRAALATLSDAGDPWSSLVTYGLLDDGSPVLVVSDLAEHGRNLARDSRASMLVWEAGEGDPLALARVTLVGRATPCSEGDAARVPGAEAYAGFGDFRVWVLEVERVRWVGGFGRMQTVDAEDYRAAG